jgi:hypothetical protein
MLTLKRVQFDFDLPACFVMLATMFSPAPAALPVMGIANQQLYRRHCPEQTALYSVIEANLTPFLEHLQERDATLPRFVTAEFKEYLRCGRLEYGFIRVKCDGCRHEHLVAFSCKRRGLLRASCPPPYGPAFGCSKSLPAILSARRVVHAG